MDEIQNMTLHGKFIRDADAKKSEKLWKWLKKKI